MADRLQPYIDAITDLRPAGAGVWDAHTHLGDDEDGMSLRPDRLLAMFDRVGIGGGCVFPLHDPERSPAYRIPNDRVLDWAAEHPGRLVPFCRLDPGDDPLPELERCLARGARGVKLHPRAQHFDFTHGALEEIFRRAHEAGVPILIHAGRGMGPIAGPLCDMALRHPTPLILAHAAIADQGTFCALLRDHPRAYYDTSVFAPVDLSELLARIPPERIVYASDPPYGRPYLALYMLLRVARAAGATDADLTGMLAGNMRAVLDGDTAPAPGPPLRARNLTVPGPLARISPLLHFAVATAIRGSTTGVDEALELSRSVCRDPDPGDAGPTLDRIAGTLADVAATVRRGDRLPVDLVYMALTDAASHEVDASAG